MFPERNALAIALILFFTITGTGSAEERVWKVAVIRFTGPELNVEHEQFRSAIPLALAQEVGKISRHNLDASERLAVFELEKQKKIRDKHKLLNGALKKRDDSFLQGDVTSVLRKEEQEINAILEAIGELQKQEYEEDLVPSQAPVELTELNSEGELHEYPNTDLLAWARKNDYDCLIWGTTEQLEQLLYSEIFMMYTATEEIHSLYRGTFFGREQNIPVDESLPVLRTRILGREWADIILEVEPETVGIELNGEEVVTDQSGRLRNLSPGKHSLTLQAPGYFDRVFNFELTHKEVKTFQVEMDKKDPVDIYIGSYPSAADVFINSLFVGKTPLLLRDRVLPATTVLRREGYSEFLGVIEKEKVNLNFHMHPDYVDVNEIIDRSRRRFYNGMAGFLLSLPLTILTYGKSTQYAYAYNSAVSTSPGNYDELERLQSKTTLWYTAYLGSMFFNAVLFTDTIVNMINYIQISQEY